MMNLDHVKSILEDVDRIALTTHEGPDGDGLGCTAAMYQYFQDIKKDCRIILPSSFPSEYLFLEKDSKFEIYSSEYMDSWLKDTDLVIVFDIGDRRRLKKIGDAIEKYDLKTLNIDHHPLINDTDFSYNLVDVNASATGEIVYDILDQCFSHPMSKEICQGIFTAIMTDTGSFRYSNTNIHSHEIAIECYKAGVNASYIYQQIYETSSRCRVKLLGAVLQDIRYEFDGEFAWFMVDSNKLKTCDATAKDVEGFSDFVRTIKGVEIALMILETGPNKCRINLRSKGKYSVNTIAKALGGGGHPFAAGAKVSKSVEKATPQILEVVRNSIPLQKESL